MIMFNEYDGPIIRNITKPQIIIFGVGNYNALGIVRSLGRQGYPIELVILNTDKKRNLVATKSKYVDSVYFVNTLEEGLSYIIKNLKDSIKPYIITDDDKAQSLVDRSYFLLKDNFRVFNAGEPGRITRYMDKKNILDIAKKHGLQVATTITVPNGIIPEDLEYPIITKSISPLEGGWKSDVFICENEEDLKTAYTKIKAKTVLLQRYIDKQNEWCLDGVSLDHGHKIITSLFSKYKYTIKGYYSPYMETKGYNQISEKERELYSKISEMLKDIGYEGIYSAEFLIDKSGEYYFTEVNFRNSTWSYMGSLLDMDLASLWVLYNSPNEIISLNEYLKNLPDNYTAMVEPIDYQKRVIERNYSRFKWFKDLLNTNCKFYFDIHDIKPWLYMFIHNKEFR